MKWLAVVAALIAGPVAACGEQTDCVVGDRTYRIAGAENASNGALIFAHGYRGSAAGVMRNGALKAVADDFGLALIAFNGVNGSWQLPNRPRNRAMTGAAEFSYAENVLADAQARFGLDASRVVMSGFSAGGMLTWNLACARPDLFAGFVPMSGTFWDPVPETCAGPVASIVHIHGDADGTVPLAGRVIADSKQGEVLEAMAMYARIGGFSQAVAMNVAPDLACRVSLNDAGNVLNICMFAGGHGFGTGRLRAGLEMLGFEAR
jgi:polyhydroxybutyrate depolymerase